MGDGMGVNELLHVATGDLDLWGVSYIAYAPRQEGDDDTQ